MVLERDGRVRQLVNESITGAPVTVPQYKKIDFCTDRGKRNDVFVKQGGNTKLIFAFVLEKKFCKELSF